MRQLWLQLSILMHCVLAARIDVYHDESRSMLRPQSRNVLGTRARLILVDSEQKKNVTMDVERDLSMFGAKYKEIEYVDGAFRLKRSTAPACQYVGVADDAERGRARVRASSCGGGLRASLRFEDGSFAEVRWTQDSHEIVEDRLPPRKFGEMMKRELPDGHSNESSSRSSSPRRERNGNARRLNSDECAPNSMKTKWIPIVAFNDARRSAARGDDTEEETALIFGLVADIYSGEIVSSGGFAGDGSIFGCDLRPRLVGQVSWTGTDPDRLDYVEADMCESSCGDTDCESGEMSSSCLLSSFGQFVRAHRDELEDLLGSFDNAQLLTGADLNGQVSGIAYIDGMCTRTNSVGIDSTRKEESALRSAALVAHELGHNLGMQHDDDTTNIMSPSSYAGGADQPDSTLEFSDYSRETAATFFRNRDPSCLDEDPPPRLGLDSTVCGDGVVAGDEECDHGVGNFDPCCRDDCTLACDCNPLSGCCDSNGRLMAKDSVCRGSVHPQCDVEELCDGVSEECPTDIYESPGVDCGNADGQCYQGACVARDDNCENFNTPYDGTAPFYCSDFSSCAELWCSDTEWCYSNGETALDGTPCGNGKQCVKQEFDYAGFTQGSSCVESSSLKEYHWDIPVSDPCVQDPPCVDETGSEASDEALCGEVPTVPGFCTFAPTISSPPTITPRPSVAPSSMPTPSPSTSKAPTSTPTDEDDDKKKKNGLLKVRWKKIPRIYYAIASLILGCCCCFCFMPGDSDSPKKGIFSTSRETVFVS